MRVSGEGPIPCDLMIIGDWVGREEARTGRVFAPRRHHENELDRFLDGVRLPERSDIYLTTWIKDWCGEDRDYTQDDFDRAEAGLIDEIQHVHPRTIICLGRYTARWFLGDIDLEEVHGIPWRLPRGSARREIVTEPDHVTIFGNYAPTAGFRSPEISSYIAYDFTQIAAFLAGEIAPRTLYDDPCPDPRYLDITDEATLDEIMVVGGRLGADTEGWVHQPWSVQLSPRPGVAYILRVQNRALIERFAAWVNAASALYHFVFHSALHDLPMFRALGVDTRRLVIDDTMIMAYNLQLEPQGLKALCTRWCGMQMQSYDDVMGDASHRLAVDWLSSVLENEAIDYAGRCEAEFTRLTTTPYIDARGKSHPGRRLKVHPHLPRTDLHKSVERCLRSQNPRKLWGDQVIDLHVDARLSYGAIWEATLDHVEPTTAIRYAGRDADGTLRVRAELDAQIDANDLRRTYNADLGTVHLVDRMGATGILPDLAHFRSLSTDLGRELSDITSRLARDLVSLGTTPDDAQSFNPNSAPQVSRLLYDRLALPELKRTPGGDPSTNDKIMEALEKAPGLDPIVRRLISTIREYREVYKLKHTFVDQIPEFTHRYPFDGRIHATFRLTRVVSGRLAASDPNLLAMPKHGKFAKRFREGFIAGDGHVLGSWDLSQAELRVLAHLSQDPVLLDAYRTGKDLHATLAQRIFGVAPHQQDDSKHRLPAKAVNFGIPMGMTNIGLCVELKKNGVDIDEEDAQRWLDETMTLYREVPTYQQHKIAEARRYGFVTDLIGRRRYVGGIRSRDLATRAEAERFAFSTPIQAGAQAIMKYAEAYVWKEVILKRQDAGQWIEPLIQIHDDLLLEFDERLIAAVDTEMQYAMTQTFRGLSVPIKTDGSIGHTWGKMTKLPAAA